MAGIIAVKVDTRQALDMLRGLAARQIPFATAVALNSMAFDVQRVERAAIPGVFAHPRPFTQRSVLVTKATKQSLASTVFIRSEVARYLEPYEFGGLHVVPGAALLKPIDIRLDQYGQLTRTQVQRLNELANTRGSNVFFGVVHGVRGYWMRLLIRRNGKGRAQQQAPRLRLLARIEEPRDVTQHLDFRQRGELLVPKIAPAAFEGALQTALGSSRP